MAIDKKDVALSVVGILAGLALTYLLWSVSQRNNAANAQAAATAAANAQAAALDQSQQEQTLTTQVASSDVSSSPTETTAEPVTSSASSSDNTIATELDQIISDYTQNQSSPSSFSNLVIPEVGDTSDTALINSNVPVTSNAALEEINGAVGSVSTTSGQTSTAPVNTPTQSNPLPENPTGSPYSFREPISPVTQIASPQ